VLALGQSRKLGVSGDQYRVMFSVITQQGLAGKSIRPLRMHGAVDSRQCLCLSWIFADEVAGIGVPKRKDHHRDSLRC
jgi:hypothetical protein